jgi:hypothetical protein
VFNYGLLNRLIVSTAVFPSKYNFSNAPDFSANSRTTLDGRKKKAMPGGTPTEELLFRKSRNTKHEKYFYCF